jgi:hypothetical protein
VKKYSKQREPKGEAERGSRRRSDDDKGEEELYRYGDDTDDMAEEYRKMAASVKQCEEKGAVFYNGCIVPKNG